MSRSPTHDIPYPCRVIDPDTHEVIEDPNCKISSPTEKEMALWGHSRLNAADAAKISESEYSREREKE
jgi:hypothetical protein